MNEQREACTFAPEINDKSRRMDQRKLDRLRKQNQSAKPPASDAPRAELLLYKVCLNKWLVLEFCSMRMYTHGPPDCRMFIAKTVPEKDI